MCTQTHFIAGMSSKNEFKDDLKPHHFRSGYPEAPVDDSRE